MELSIITPEETQTKLLALTRREPTVQLLLESQSKYCLEVGIKSELDCFHSKTVTLRRLEKEIPQAGMALLVVLISDLADSFNIGKNMTGNQVAEAAALVLHEFSDFKIDDFVLCFTKAKKGAYGKIYDRFDVLIIFDFLNRYSADKDEQIEFYQLSLHKEVQKDSDLKVLPNTVPAGDETAKKYLRAIADDVKAIQEKGKQKLSLESKPRELTEDQKLFNRFSKQFETHYLLRPFPSRTGRFIKKYGRVMNIQDFLNYKSEQIYRAYNRVPYVVKKKKAA